MLSILSTSPTTHPPAQLRAATRHCTICLLRHTQLCGQQRLKEIALKRLFKQESWLIHPRANCLATAAGRRQQSPPLPPLLLLYRGISLWDGAKHGWNRDPGITVCCKAAVKVSRWRSRQIRSHTGIVQNWKSKKVGKKGQKKRKSLWLAAILRLSSLSMCPSSKSVHFDDIKLGYFFYFFIDFWLCYPCCGIYLVPDTVSLWP